MRKCIFIFCQIKTKKSMAMKMKNVGDKLFKWLFSFPFRKITDDQHLNMEFSIEWKRPFIFSTSLISFPLTSQADMKMEQTKCSFDTIEYVHSTI